MANVCSRCGTDNADGALACRQCGASLASPAGWSRSLIPDDDNFDPLSAPTLVMRHTVPSELPPLEDILIPPEPEPSRFRPRLMLGLAAFVVLLGGAVWLMRPASQAPAPAPAMVAPAASLPAPVAAEPSPAPATSLPASAAGASAAPAPMAPVVAASAPPAAPAAPSAPERRKRIPEPVGRKQAAEATSAAAPVVEPPVAAPAPVASPAPLPAPEPVKPKSVTELCSAGNLLTRGFCEHRECAKAEYTGDPVCVRIKEAEEARRFRQ